MENRFGKSIIIIPRDTSLSNGLKSRIGEQHSTHIVYSSPNTPHIQVLKNQVKPVPSPEPILRPTRFKARTSRTSSQNATTLKNASIHPAARTVLYALHQPPNAPGLHAYDLPPEADGDGRKKRVMMKSAVHASTKKASRRRRRVSERLSVDIVLRIRRRAMRERGIVGLLSPSLVALAWELAGSHEWDTGGSESLLG